MSINGSPRKLDMAVARELGELTAEIRALKDSVDKMSNAAEKKTDRMNEKIAELQERAFWNQAKISGIIMLFVGLGIEGLKALV